MMKKSLVFLAALAGACDDGGEDLREAPHVCLDEPAELPAPGTGCEPGEPAFSYPAITEACRFESSTPSHLLITTTDFSTGALSIFDIAARRLDNDVALGSTDALPFYFRGMVYLLHRYGFDYVDLLDPGAGYANRGQHSLAIDGVTAPNAQWLAFRYDGLAFVTVMGHHTVRVLDFSRPAGTSLVGEVDLSAFADADGKPESGLGIVCGDTLFVAAQRLDPNFAPVGPDTLVPVDMRHCAAHSDSLDLLGSWAKQVRRDPLDPTGRTALLLTTGIERVDLAAAEVSWAVPDSVFAALGLGSFNLMDFVVTPDGGTFYVAAALPDYSEVRIWRVERGEATATEVAVGLNAIGTTLALAGSELWFGDNSYGASGLRAYDLTRDPPAPLLGPLSTGLAPYSIRAIP